MKYLQDILVIMKDKMLITQFKNLLKDAGFSVNLCLDLKKLDDNFDYKAIFIDVFSQEAFWQKHKNNISEFDRVFVFLGNDNKILPKLKFANPIYLPFAFQSFFEICLNFSTRLKGKTIWEFIPNVSTIFKLLKP